MDSGSLNRPHGPDYDASTYVWLQGAGHPCDVAKSGAHPRLRQLARITDLNDAVISIIDDDEAARSAVAALVLASGYQALAFESAESFLASPAMAGSNCIITDLQMPGLTGIELKQRLDAVACQTPVIMITARVEERLHTQARDSGAFGFLRKPFKASALMDCVRRALSHGADPTATEKR